MPNTKAKAQTPLTFDEWYNRWYVRVGKGFMETHVGSQSADAMEHHLSLAWAAGLAAGLAQQQHPEVTRG